MKKRILGAAFAGLMMTAALGAAAPAPAAPPAAANLQQYYPGPGIYCGNDIGCMPIAYSHEVYSDAGLTNLIATGSDSCTGSGSQVYVSSPQLPGGYDVKTPMYVCTDFGPYLPMDW